MNFSSLMFLQRSPPKVTRRSRLDQLLLLLLRGLALALLAFAFARPFLRQEATATSEIGAARRVAILVDASASMRRGDLWQQAVRAAQDAVERCGPDDQVSVFTFDQTLHRVASSLDLTQIDWPRRAEAVRDQLRRFSPGWSTTHLGQALIDGLGACDEMLTGNPDANLLPRRLVLISDLPASGRLEALGENSWPEDAHLELVPLQPDPPGNAGLHRLGGNRSAHESDDRRLHVRVVNAGTSDVELFHLQWQTEEGAVGKPVVVNAPAGESRVALVPPPPANAERPRLVLSGDHYDFDNTIYHASRDQRTRRVDYIGSHAIDQPEGMPYYLQQALESVFPGNVELVVHPPDDSELEALEQETALVVVGGSPSAAQLSGLNSFVAEGGTLLLVLTEPDQAAVAAELFSVDAVQVDEATVDGYAMLGEVDFAHRLFKSMAAPQYNDFTQIRFWKYRRIKESDLSAARVVARFENGDPALLEQSIGDGSVALLAAGWHPEDSQLARSWRFLPMLTALANGHASAESFAARYFVGDRAPLPEDLALGDAPVLTTPDGRDLLLNTDVTELTDLAQPGIYALKAASGPIHFAVDLDPAESLTDPLPREAFQQLGCRLETEQLDAPERLQRMRQLHDIELESSQKGWKWLMVAALGVLILETGLAGKRGSSHEL